MPELKVVSGPMRGPGTSVAGWDRFGMVGLGFAFSEPLPCPLPTLSLQPWSFFSRMPLITASPLPLLQGIVGNLSSGKSALVHRYLTGTYVQEESPEGEPQGQPVPEAGHTVGPLPFPPSRLLCWELRFLLCLAPMGPSSKFGPDSALRPRGSV